MSPPIFDVRVAQWDGSAWNRLGGPVNGPTATQYAEPLSLAAIDGQPWVGFMQENGGDDAVVDQWTGSAWQAAAPPLHTQVAGSSTKLPVVTAVAGVPWVAWLDDDSEAAPNGDVYAATQALDTQPPVAGATITGSGGVLGPGTYTGPVSVAGTATDPPPSSGTPTVRCALDPATVPAGYADLGGASCTPLVTDPGSHTFYVAARDPAGNASSVVSLTFTVVAPPVPPPPPPVITPPDTIITSGPTGNTWTALPSYTFTSTVPGSVFTCSVDGGPAGTCESPRSIGPFTAGSTHTFSVQATSPAGVTDPTPAVATVHVNAAQTTSQDCDVTPFPVYYPTRPPPSVATACDFRFGPASDCTANFRCITSPDGCPAAASCTLRVDSQWVDGDQDVAWIVQAWSDLVNSTESSCTVPDDNRACATHSSKTFFGPRSLEGVCTTTLDPSGTYGPDADRELKCAASMTVTPARPLGIIGGGGGIGIFVPGGGVLVLAPSAGGASAGLAQVARRAAPAFRKTTISVAVAGAVRFVPRLSAAARRSYRRRHRLTIPVRMSFAPSGGGPAVTRTVTTTLTPAPKRRRRCPARLPKHLKQALVCRPK